MRVSPNVDTRHRPMRRAIAALAVALTACATRGSVSRGIPRNASQGDRASVSPLPAPAWKTDSMQSRELAAGLVYRSYVIRSAPLAVHVLDVDLAACWTVRTIKAGNQAVGRATTTALVSSVAAAGAVAGVNADFFAFVPPGVPVGLTVANSTLLTGANPSRPLFMLTADGAPWIGFGATVADFTFGAASRRHVPWNVLSRDTVHAGEGVIDARWGDSTAALVAPRGIAIVPRDGKQTRDVSLNRSVKVRAEPVAAGASLRVPVNGWLWVTHGPGAIAPTIQGNGVMATRFVVSSSPIKVDSLSGHASRLPREAVGGQPVLVRDSAVAPEVETTGNAAFRGVNPRTALGIAANGRRLFLVVIDGRQPGYSVGTSLRETAEIMRSLGARDAINLDGGGSSALVLRQAITNAFGPVNKPSDKEGERPVGDALVVVPACAPRPSR